jgi:hypothetical protein
VRKRLDLLLHLSHPHHSRYAEESRSIGLRLARVAAFIREEAEDMWAEAHGYYLCLLFQ